MWNVFLQQTGLKQKHIIYVLAAIIAFIVLVPLFTYVYFANDLKDKKSIVNSNNTGVILVDRNNKPFYSFNNPKTITYMQIADISTDAQHAAIASEDKDFYKNPGFSIPGMLRALYIDVLNKSSLQGGSTITQQLVKNALLDSNKNFLRKYQEIVLAYELNRRYTKNDILEMYLNSVYFGEGAFGIENASETYFGIHAKELDLAQSSLLISILPAPSALSPISNGIDNAKKHQTIVLEEMVNQGYISQDQATVAENEVLSFVPKKVETNIIAPHFALYVKDLLIKQYGEETISRSGFTVKTSLNLDWQKYAEQVVQSQVHRLSGDNVSNGAAVVMDPKTGEIEAMVGSENWDNSDFGKVNMTITTRQPGSSFKPIIYADALAKQLITPATILQDTKTTFPGNYSPHDFDYAYRGPVTVRRALANSLNIPAVDVMQKLGVDEGVSFAQNLGITTLSNPSQYGLSFVLGTGEIKLLELTDVYATFANSGQRNPATAILSIIDKHNQTIYSYVPPDTQTIDPNVAYLITSILSDNQARAEEFGNALTLSHPAAVKTGTTEDFRDALTLGYTPNLTVGVWVGNNTNAPMDNIAGSLGAAPIWRQLMEHFSQQLSYASFEKPQSIQTALVCPYMNLNSTLATSSGYFEFFLPDTNPENTCNQTITSTEQPTMFPTQLPSPTDVPVTPQQPTLNPTSSQPTATPTITISPTDTFLPTFITPTPSIFIHQPSNPFPSQ